MTGYCIMCLFYVSMLVHIQLAVTYFIKPASSVIYILIKKKKVAPLIQLLLLNRIFNLGWLRLSVSWFTTSVQTEVSQPTHTHGSQRMDPPDFSDEMAQNLFQALKVPRGCIPVTLVIPQSFLLHQHEVLGEMSQQTLAGCP